MSEGAEHESQRSDADGECGVAGMAVDGAMADDDRASLGSGDTMPDMLEIPATRWDWAHGDEESILYAVMQQPGRTRAERVQQFIRGCANRVGRKPSEGAVLSRWKSMSAKLNRDR